MQNTKSCIIQLNIYKFFDNAMKKFGLLLVLFFFLAVNAQAKTISGSINDLLKKKQNLKCTYQFKSGKQTLKGMMYLSNQKFKSEFKTKINNKTITTYSLSDGKNMYNWTSQNLQGTKINLKQAQKLGQQKTEENNDQNLKEVNKQLQTKYKFQCQKFIPKSNFFKPPTKIKFTDLGQMLQGLKQLQQNTCTMCNSLPQEAKQACLQSCQ